MKQLACAIAGLLVTLSWSHAVLAKNAAPASATNGPGVSFPSVSMLPVPLQSISGRWSSLNPRNRVLCFYSRVTGRVVSTRLILVKEMDCGQGVETADVLLNVQLSNPADAVQMVTGRHVVIKGIFRSAQEHSPKDAFYLIAEKAELVAGDPRSPPAPAFMSYMMCQPQELDALAKKLGSELCVQSTIVANLTLTGPALETAARAPANLSPGDIVSGDPNAISCRLDPGLSDPQLQAIACARNNYWDWYNKMWRIPFSPTLAPP